MAKDSKMFRARVDPIDVAKVAELVKQMGFLYGEDSPYWGEWFRAIAQGDVLMFKKVDPPS